MANYLSAVQGLNVVKSVHLEADVDEPYMLDETRHLLALAERADNPLEGIVACGRPEREDFKSYLDKIAGRNVVDVRGGNIGIEIRMGVNYTEAVVGRRMSLEDYAAVTSTNAAKLLGLYPKKGAIAVGSDADITIIDPAVKKTLRMADLHVRDYSPWEGWRVEGWPTTVILRGKVMVANGQLLGSPSDGQLIARKIDPRVLRRPAF